MTDFPPLVAFAGLAGSGKDEAARALLAHGYARHNFGDIIKRQVDPLIHQHFGFSAFTEDRSQKERVRRTLESWGEDNYDAILTEYLDRLPPRAVNTRLVRVREAREWTRRGGVIVLIERPEIRPATQWEADRLAELLASGRISATVRNDRDVIGLHAATLATLAELTEIPA